jgi:cholesterol transport system auxiliary component
VLPASASASAPASGLRLRLGRIQGSSHLRERIVFRNANGELGYYEGRRWTERPEDYVRRALSRALFEERGLTRVVSGAAPTLELELVGFEEIRGPARTARIEAVVVLHDERVVQLEQTVRVERPVRAARDDASAAAVVKALAEALHAAVVRIADEVSARLRAPPPLPEGSSEPPLADQAELPVTPMSSER